MLLPSFAKLLVEQKNNLNELRGICDTTLRIVDKEFETGQESVNAVIGENFLKF